MAQIIKNYTSLEKYEQDVEYNPEGLKPSTCKECGCNNIWCNSFYERAVSGRCANRQKADPIAILRFKCSRCKNHYSVLPSIIPLLRWYLWCMQQWVLSMVLNGYSMQKAAKEAEVNRKTVSRWYHWLKNKFKIKFFVDCGAAEGYHIISLLKKIYDFVQSILYQHKQNGHYKITFNRSYQ